MGFLAVSLKKSDVYFRWAAKMSSRFHLLDGCVFLCFDFSTIRTVFDNDEWFAYFISFPARIDIGPFVVVLMWFTIQEKIQFDFGTKK